jgi:hypothetical protein
MQGRADSETYAAAISKVVQVAAQAPAFRAHLAEVLAGRAFKGSQRSREFLRYVVERALAGEFEELRERNIGIAVFARRPDYDTAEDAIVRVTASDVRKRLLQHYGDPGVTSRLRIELPAGCYVPEFRTLPSVSPEAPAPAEPAPRPPSPARRLKWAVVCALAGLAAVAAVWAAQSRLLLSRIPPPNLISLAFQDSSGPIQIVTSDDAYVLIQVLLGRHFTLQEYEDLNYLALPDLVREKHLERFWSSLSTRQIANLGDLQNAGRIADDLRRRDWQANVRHARQAHARDFRSGNFILFGGTFSNPWAGLFSSDEANFTTAPGLSDPPGLPPTILNRQPRPGESPSYSVTVDQATGRIITYARIRLCENASHTARALLVAGGSMSSTEMAGEYLLRPEAVAGAARMLGVPAGARLPECELLLRVTEFNEVGEGVELIACRRK